MAAAVADYGPAAPSGRKIKKDEASIVLELVRRPDLLAEIGAARKGRRPVLVGFAVESEGGDALVASARRKLAEKRVDLVVANEASASFGRDDNVATLVEPGATKALGPLPKTALADVILDRVASLLLLLTLASPRRSRHARRRRLHDPAGARACGCDAARAGGVRVAFVPTMGALHAGHVALVEDARRRGGFVVVSIFVNALQFGPNEDYARYPRDLAGDLRKLETAGVDLVFSPEPAAMYADGDQTRVRVARIAEPLEGARRPWALFEGGQRSWSRSSFTPSGRASPFSVARTTSSSSSSGAWRATCSCPSRSSATRPSASPMVSR